MLKSVYLYLCAHVFDVFVCLSSVDADSELGSVLWGREGRTEGQAGLREEKGDKTGSPLGRTFSFLRKMAGNRKVTAGFSVSVSVCDCKKEIDREKQRVWLRKEKEGIITSSSELAHLCFEEEAAQYFLSSL